MTRGLCPLCCLVCGERARLRHWPRKSVIVIEHHLAVMAHAGWITDLCRGAGHDGGRVVFEGQPADLVAARHTRTGRRFAEYVPG